MNTTSPTPTPDQALIEVREALQKIADFRYGAPESKKLADRMYANGFNNAGGYAKDRAREGLAALDRLAVLTGGGAGTEPVLETIEKAIAAGEPHWTTEKALGEWFKRKVEAEGDLEVGAGSAALTPQPAWQPTREEQFDHLRRVSQERQTAWCEVGDEVPDLTFRAVELAGEVGEAMNVVKKLERERHGWRGSRATLSDLSEELADVIICADLLAATAGVDLWPAVVAKFNATSEKVGLPHILALFSDRPNPWRGIESAPRDGTPIWALFRSDIYPVLKPGRDDLKRWNGVQACLRHQGVAPDGFDIGWNMAAPVGSGGFPDEWIVGWMPLPPAPTTGDAT